MMWIKELYGTDKPIIAMLHLLPMLATRTMLPPAASKR